MSGIPNSRFYLYFCCFFISIGQYKVYGQSGLSKIYEYISNHPEIGNSKKTYKTLLVDSLNQIDYIKPFKKLLADKPKYTSLDLSREFYYEAGILATFIADYRSAIAFFDSSENISRTKKIELNELQKSRYDSLEIANLNVLYSAIDTSRIVMLNESHHKSLNRVFAYSLLDYLYSKGFRYFAAEALQNISKLNFKSKSFYLSRDVGFYTLDPAMAELFRYALHIGFRLIPYEFTGDMLDREIMQAFNISKAFNESKDNKLFVYAGYGHIEKEKSEEFKPMGYFLNMFTGVNPLTINQERYTEGNVNSVSQEGYKYLVKKYGIIHPSVLMKNGRSFFVGNKQMYDFYLLHPTTLQNELRPNWLSKFSISKERVQIKDIQKDCFLVQAFYSNELKKAKNLNKIIPADQTYDSSSGYFLYIKKGIYNIIQRDIDNNIIYNKKLNIK